MLEEIASASARPLDPGSPLSLDTECSGDGPGRAAVDFPVAVVLPAGGSGERMGLPTPKQFCTILNRPLISYTIQAFERLSWIGTVVVVVAKENHDLMLNIVREFHHTKVKVVHGGTSRHRSIFNGLQAFSNNIDDSLTPKPKVVIIHDAVRPFVEEDLLLKITLAAKAEGASGAIRPLVSTVIATTLEGYLDHSLERAKYRASEMPQGFLYDIIFQAYQRCSEYDFDFGTECLHLALQYCGTNAKLIEGPPTLWKVTYKRDLAAAEAIIKETLSTSACVITEAAAEAVELAGTLQKNLTTQGMVVTDVIPCAKESYTDCLSKSRSFIQIAVKLNTTKRSFDTQKTDELTTFMRLASEVKQANVQLYGIQIDHTKVSELWERSAARLADITVALIRDRNPALIGQLLQA
ncbi:D-ribitol-5-phosphate cytidylyltransferase isoform X2 [Triplophysa dalaica]|uniref:D-ribitol-5-phosphate cytidylyltransferase isoform X2 n=1 Tax=Triplophysa dalaica TaxID=1582913 RepID=UPI0024DF62C7|nr:D-ribitol-5-phosphate cytidylyltransferase isoform X2 [Triplophysa dalaica]